MRSSVEIVLQTAARLVFRVQIEQRERNPIGLKPFHQGEHKPVFPTPPLPPMVKTTRLLACGFSSDLRLILLPSVLLTGPSQFPLAFWNKPQRLVLVVFE